jgi:hypothetical protein
VTTKLFSLIMAFAYRRARAYGGRIWWVVLAVAALLRALESRSEKSRVYRLSDDEVIDVAVRRAT